MRHDIFPISSHLNQREAGLYCPICMDDSVEPQNFFGLQCGHFYCGSSCWGNYLKGKVSDREVSIHCPQQGCSHVLTSEEIEYLEGRETFSEYQKNVIKSFVEDKHIRSRVTYCKNPSGCEGVLFPSTVGSQAQCGQCHFRFCMKCELPSHAPALCKTVEKWAEKGGYIPRGNPEEMKTQKLKLLTTKPCPKCGVRIEKNDGCPHMTCRRQLGGCSYEFCWDCGGPNHTSGVCNLPKVQGEEGSILDFDAKCHAVEGLFTFQSNAIEKIQSIEQSLQTLRSLFRTKNLPIPASSPTSIDPTQRQQMKQKIEIENRNCKAQEQMLSLELAALRVKEEVYEALAFGLITLTLNHNNRLMISLTSLLDLMLSFDGLCNQIFSSNQSKTIISTIKKSKEKKNRSEDDSDSDNEDVDQFSTVSNKRSLVLSHDELKITFSIQHLKSRLKSYFSVFDSELQLPSTPPTPQDRKKPSVDASSLTSDGLVLVESLFKGKNLNGRSTTKKHKSEEKNTHTSRYQLTSSSTNSSSFVSYLPVFSSPFDLSPNNIVDWMLAGDVIEIDESFSFSSSQEGHGESKFDLSLASSPTSLFFRLVGGRGYVVREGDMLGELELYWDPIRV